MRRLIAPIGTALLTATLLLATATVPALADGGAGGRDLGTGCVTVIDPPPTTSFGAFGISDGPGGVWFSHGTTVDRVVGQHIVQYPVPDTATARIGTLAGRPGGPVWFADQGNNRIGAIDIRGVVATYDIPHQSGTVAIAQGIVIGPGRDVWFTDQVGGTIDRLDTRTASFDIHPVPTPNSGPQGMTRGADGALWFVERLADKVGRLDRDGTFTEWPLRSGAFPNRITVGPDRAIWFTELNAGLLGRIDRTGQLTEYPITGGPVGITTGPGPYLYVSLYTDHALAQVDTSGAVTARWDLPGAAGPTQAATIDNAIWVTDFTSDLVYRVRPHCQAPTQ